MLAHLSRLLERLNRADQLLREHDRSQTTASPASVAAYTPGSAGQGKLFKSEGSVRFVDNDLWNAVESELPEVIEERSSEAEDDVMTHDRSCELIMGISTSPDATLDSFHPSPPQIRHLWQVFLENVDPMTKVVHTPTTAKIIDRACEVPRNLDKADEALLFAIYLSAVISMTAEEVRNSMGEPRSSLSQRYQKACREALVRAKFIRTSNVRVLASFVIYLVSCIPRSLNRPPCPLIAPQQALRTSLDSATFYTLTGVASRIAQGLGLHQYGGNLGLPVFETEMRSRTWWQVLWLEFRSAERIGSDKTAQFFLHDNTAPRNIDDADFWPGQTEQELEEIMEKRGQNRATEMLNILILCENGNFWREQMTKDGNIDPYGASKSPFVVQHPNPRPWQVELKQKLIDELESRIEEKYLRYCDPSIASQLLATIHIRGSMAYMRLMTHHPRRWSSAADIPVETRDLVWKLCMRILDLDALQRNTQSLQKFAWKFSEYFHWQALVYVLQELRKEPSSDRAVEGFARIHEAFRIHPSFVANRIPLHVALCSLVLKVWDARVNALKQLGAEEAAPAYIETLLKRREATATAAAAKASRQKAEDVREQNTLTEATGHATPAQENGVVSETRPEQSAPVQTTQHSYMDYVPVGPQMEQVEFPFMGGNGELQDATFMDWDMWDNLIQDFQQSAAAPYS